MCAVSLRQRNGNISSVWREGRNMSKVILREKCEWASCMEAPVWHISGVDGGTTTWDYCDEHFKTRIEKGEVLTGISYHPRTVKKKP